MKFLLLIYYQVRYFRAFSVLLSASCLFSCSSVKEFNESGKVIYQQKDSVFLNQLLHTDKLFDMRIERVTLSKPDSIGLQFAETITTITANTEERHTEERQESQLYIQNAEQQLSTESIGYKNLFPVRYLVIFFPVLIVCCLFIRKLMK